MKRKKTITWIAAIIIIIIVATISYQTYSIYSIQKNLNNVNLELSTHKSNIEIIREDLTGITSELIEFSKESSSQFSSLTSKLEESVIQIEGLQEDVSNIQVESLDFSAIVDDVLESVVSIITNKGQGSGVIIKEDGYIITNYHVIEDAKSIRVLTFDRNLHNAEIIGISKDADIALLKIPKEDLDFLKFGDSDEVKIGQRVIALGNPAGLSFSVTEGIVSATNRVGPNGVRAYIQTDVPINPGNSGGPLVNINKEIVGINNFKIGGFEGLGFAIDSDHVKDIVDQIFEKLEAQES